MTVHEQLKWLRQEQQRNQRLLEETMVIGQMVLDKARLDLAAIAALIATVRDYDQPLFRAPAREER